MWKWFLDLSDANKIKLITGVLTGFYIFVGAIVSVLVYRWTKKKEILFKLHDERRKVYDEYLKLLFDFASKNKGKKDIEIPKNFEEKLHDIQRKLILFSSKKFMKINTRYFNITRTNGEKLKTAGELILILGEMVITMREELNLGAIKRIKSKRAILSIFITDIHDEKYDILFLKERNIISKSFFYMKFFVKNFFKKGKDSNSQNKND